LATIEKEAKLTISPQDYARLKGGGVLQSRRDQLNVYLHDPARLGQGLGYLRVRFQSRRPPVATLKIPKTWDGMIREMVEIECPLSELGAGLNPWPRRHVVVASNLPEAMERHFTTLGITRLRRLGWMRNLRCVLEVGGVGSIELDRTVLPGGDLHHEVEIETQDDELLERLVALVRKEAPSAEPSTVGKFSRFLEAIGGPPPGGPHP
jgi:hypothetical protein